MNDYVSFFLDYPDPIKLLRILLLAMMRLAPIVVMAPFFGAKLLPGPVKIGLILSISFVLMPQLMELTQGPLPFDLTYVALMLKEMVIGLFMGFLLAIPFWTASSSGTLIDNQRGSSSMMMNDPTLQIQASPIGQLYNYVLIYSFFIIGGIFYFMDGLSLSYSFVPPDRFIHSVFFLDHDLPFWKKIMDAANLVLSVAVQMAAPALVAILMSDLFLGISNRMAPQVPMAFLGWALKSLVGLAALWLAWYYILQQLNHHTIEWLSTINHDMAQLTAGQTTPT